uniref:Uncharacterized protein n=1 Tax=Rhizophagus irregularis TaxID=588596 RepID=X5GZC7_9GLOM|nr:hypothetical protein [Rhizophagus irregularis]
MCLILEVKPKFVYQMFLSGLIVLAIALLFKVKGNSRITIALYAFWNSPLAIRLVWLFLSIICIVLLSAFNDPVFCTGSDNNGGTTPTHISTSISNKSVSDTPISLNFNFTTTLKTGATAAGLGYGIAKVVKAVPPASKAGVAVALSAVVGATVVASKALSRGSNNSNNSSISEFARSLLGVPMPLEGKVKNRRWWRLLGYWIYIWWAAASICLYHILWGCALDVRRASFKLSFITLWWLDSTTNSRSTYFNETIPLLFCLINNLDCYFKPNYYLFFGFYPFILYRLY